MTWRKFWGYPLASVTRSDTVTVGVMTVPEPVPIRRPESVTDRPGPMSTVSSSETLRVSKVRAGVPSGERGPEGSSTSTSRVPESFLGGRIERRPQQQRQADNRESSQSSHIDLLFSEGFWPYTRRADQQVVQVGGIGCPEEPILIWTPLNRPLPDQPAGWYTPMTNRPMGDPRPVDPILWTAEQKGYFGLIG